MSNFIEVLERIGQDSQVRYATPAQLEALLTSHGVSPHELASQSRRITCCLVRAPEGEEDREDESARAA